jgi:hypothetical protein
MAASRCSTPAFSRRRQRPACSSAAVIALRIRGGNRSHIRAILSRLHSMVSAIGGVHGSVFDQRPLGGPTSACRSGDGGRPDRQR